MIYKKLKESTLNYLLNQPTPAYLFVVSLNDDSIYWVSLREHFRNLGIGQNTTHIQLLKSQTLCEVGALRLDMSRILETQWHRTEKAVISAMMFFEALGPLTLGCFRYPHHAPIPSSVQHLLIAHYENNQLIQRYVFHTEDHLVPLEDQYKVAMSANLISSDFRFSGLFAAKFLETFIREYVRAIEKLDEIVRSENRSYWVTRYPLHIAHLDAFPPYFVADDWYPRFYFDELQSETRHIDLSFFADVDSATRDDFEDFMVRAP